MEKNNTKIVTEGIFDIFKMAAHFLVKNSKLTNFFVEVKTFHKHLMTSYGGEYVTILACVKIQGI